MLRLGFLLYRSGRDDSIRTARYDQELLVDLGTIVRPGDLLARVGRSGLNAAGKRSPTHLHFSVLELKNNLPVARNVYKELLHTRKVEAR
jgi:murein DD-endopeptidase MepM/ murein hydrolase activator NlpD